MKNKKCPICNEIKTIDNFRVYLNKKTNNKKVFSYCIPCEKKKSIERSKKSYIKNREKTLEYKRINRKKYDEQIKGLKEKYRNELRDSYVAEVLSKKLKCSKQEIYNNPELLQSYKNILKIKKIIKEHGTK
jgi:uncharacterized protein YlaI